MGTRVKTVVERRFGDTWEFLLPETGSWWEEQSYAAFAVLANIRNYSSHSPGEDWPPPQLYTPIKDGVFSAELPQNVTEESAQVYSRVISDSPSYVIYELHELVHWNWDTIADAQEAISHQRETIPHQRETTYRQAVGELFLEFVDHLRSLGNPYSIRVIFIFD